MVVHCRPFAAQAHEIAARGAPMTERKGPPSHPASYLPEDIWHHIHSLMPTRRAARAACLSRGFLHSWRCRPRLRLALGTVCPNRRDRRSFGYRIDMIMKNHSGTSLKIFQLHLPQEEEEGKSVLPHIDGWLQIALVPGIEEVILWLHQEYNFPCALLSHGVRSSIRNLHLSKCAFRPTADLGPLRSLTSLQLRSVGITGGELECLLSNSPALEKLDLYDCNEISFLKIPCMLLQQLRVISCGRLKLIEGGSPNLRRVEVFDAMIRLAEAPQMKYLHLGHSDGVRYAFSELPSIMPSLETLILSLETEGMGTLMPPAKFLHLRHLAIYVDYGLSPPSYDYLSLAALLDASPSLETLSLRVFQDEMEHESVLGGSSDLRHLPEHCYGCLRKVTISGFSSAKSLVELTRCIVKNAASLECLVFETFRGGNIRRCRHINKTCWPISENERKESSRAFVAIRRYIEGIVPPTVELSLVEPCSQCHAPRARRGAKRRLSA